MRFGFGFGSCFLALFSVFLLFSGAFCFWSAVEQRSPASFLSLNLLTLPWVLRQAQRQRGEVMSEPEPLHVSSAGYQAVHAQFAVECEDVLQAFLLCKAKSLNPLVCQKEATALGKCQDMVYRNVRKVAGMALETHIACIQSSFDPTYSCRETQAALRAAYNKSKS